MRTVVALANQTGVDHVFRRVRPQTCQSILFGRACGKRAEVKFCTADICRNDGVDKRIHGIIAQGFEHVCLLGRVRTDVAMGKSGGSHDLK